MSDHSNCYICKSSKLSINELRAKIIWSMRQIENNPGSTRSMGAKAQLITHRENIAKIRENQKYHLENEEPRDHS